MGLKKGQCNNRAGKPIGALNRINRDMKQTIHDFLQDSWPEVLAEFHKLSGRDKCNFYKDLMQYDVPKKQAVAVSGEIDFKTMAESDLDSIAYKLYNYGKNKK